MTAPITTAEFKAFFVRDFEYGTQPSLDSPSATVMDSDIQAGINEGILLFNPELWPDAAGQKPPFYQLAAHCMVQNIKNAGGLNQIGQGVVSTGTSPINNKSVGPVSVGYSLPDKVVNNPAFSYYLTTGYGQKYLQMLMPRLVGNIALAGGGTTP
jgi:hypothetical protein